MANTHIVNRTFPNTPEVRRGQEVDASEWRNAALLERQGYLVPIEKGSELEKTPAETVEEQPVVEADETPEEIIFEEEEIEIETSKPKTSAAKPAAKNTSAKKK